MTLIIKNMRLTVIVGIILIVSVSCNLSKKYEREEAEEIQQYLDSHTDLNFELKPSGLYYLEVLAGTGEIATVHDTAYVIYTGKYLNGTPFDTNVGKDSLIFPVGEGFTIEGFDEGITYMREKGKSTFLIPSRLGWGSSGYYMPAYTPIVFEVELARLVQGPGR
ncbi:MAG: FKBP-type peptidyl-prolyl cis-trans isomerase [Bacteroidales bacterium]|nr:FKBP-type peptidyl-prolyl cis-trans isomerase [Bacteroidales bacterium]